MVLRNAAALAAETPCVSVAIYGRSELAFRLNAV
jgi:hypothetical protein